jgi:transposase-like protein
MRTSRLTEEQIRYAVQQVEAGRAAPAATSARIASWCPQEVTTCSGVRRVPELGRKYGVAQPTFYRWRQKYGALTKNELARLKDLGRENARLKKLVAELTLDTQIL